jgi:hypothetical protein
MDNLNIVKSLLKYHYEYQSTGRLRLPAEDAQKLQSVYMDLFKVRANVGCPTCCSHYLAMLDAWFQKNNTPIDVQPPEVVEPIKKGKNKKQ